MGVYADLRVVYGTRSRFGSFRLADIQTAYDLFANRATETAPSGIVLIGALPTYPAKDLGWIVPASSTEEPPVVAQEVRRFVEKPSPEVAEGLLREGACGIRS